MIDWLWSRRWGWSNTIHWLKTRKMSFKSKKNSLSVGCRCGEQSSTGMQWLRVKASMLKTQPSASITGYFLTLAHLLSLTCFLPYAPTAPLMQQCTTTHHLRSSCSRLIGSRLLHFAAQLCISVCIVVCVVLCFLFCFFGVADAAQQCCNNGNVCLTVWLHRNKP